MAGRTHIVFTEDTLTPRLRNFTGTLNKALTVFMAYQETKVQDYMRQNAPWTDRTANARGGLFAKNVSQLGTYAIVCYHTVPYGIWLEIAHDGHFRIIQPTIQAEGHRIMGELGQLMGIMNGVD